MKNKKLTDEQFNTLVKVFVIFVLAYFISGVALAMPKPIKIAVIDTGFDFKSEWKNLPAAKPKLCPDGHKFFAGKDLNDNHGHGTHIAGLIAKNNQDIDYCLIIIKYYDPRAGGDTNMVNEIEAFKYALTLGVDIINYSGGGTSYSGIECKLMDQIIKSGTIVVAAAGNERSNLNRIGYYPAMCNTFIYKVAARTVSNKRLPASNYATSYIPNLYVELGENVYSILPNNLSGVMSGTSQATATFTGKLAHRLYMYRCVYDFERAQILNRTA